MRQKYPIPNGRAGERAGAALQVPKMLISLTSKRGLDCHARCQQHRSASLMRDDAVCGSYLVYPVTRYGGTAKASDGCDGNHRGGRSARKGTVMDLTAKEALIQHRGELETVFRHIRYTSTSDLPTGSYPAPRSLFLSLSLTQLPLQRHEGRCRRFRCIWACRDLGAPCCLSHGVLQALTPATGPQRVQRS